MNRSLGIRYPVRVSALAFSLALAPLPVLKPICWGDSMSPRKYNFFLKLYQELNSANAPVEDEFANPEQWAVEHESELEPIVVAILRGEREDIPWNYALSIAAPLMPTKAIRDEVYARMDSMFSQKLAANAPLDERNHGLLSSMAAVLAAGQDNRATQVLNRLLDRDEYDYHIGRKYLLALRRVGDASSLEPLGAMPLRKSNERIDRMAGLTEKIIEARIKGEVFPPEAAPEELRVVTQRFLRAFEERDVHAYVSCFPWVFHNLFDAKTMQEFLEDEHGKAALAVIQPALDTNTPFEIDRKTLQAKLACDAGYVVEYIYEVDGWKIMNVKPPPSTHARNEVRQQAAP
ncbi:MAG: hypothetical protein KJ749_13990 [Planctomycetes bacterium]|nr:hypothetical protein [Planctomycetota bacterium]